MLLLAGPALAAPPVNRHFALAGQGQLLLTEPASWQDKLNPSAEGTPPSILITPRGGGGFELHLQPVYATAPGAAAPENAQIRATVAAAESVEQTLALHEIVGDTGSGYYFSATDRAPKPGECKYMIQGMLRVGSIAVIFTLLSNDGQDGQVRAALELLRHASQAP
jgi:hypothetical protein